jgi:hypothetical protein
MAYSDAQILETARAVRAELDALLPPADAARLDERLGELLARAEEGDDIADAVLALLWEEDRVRRWAIDRLGEAGDRARRLAEKGVPPAPVDAPRPTRRYLNLAVADERTQLLDRSRTLVQKGNYLVRIDIGALARESVVENPVEFPAELLEPSSTEGYWLELVAASHDLDVSPAIHRFFLPFAGASWVCGCPGPDHVCLEDERCPFLYVSFSTRDANPDASLRCTVYHRNNAVQSACIRLVVADGGERAGAQRAVVDYTLSRHFGELERFPARRLNVLTNETPGGTHRIVVKDDEHAVPVDLTEAAVGDVLEAVRAALRRISLGTNGEESQYDADNRKSTDELVADLSRLATLGSFFWTAVVPYEDDRLHLGERLRRRATIQVSRITRVVFPWAVVYDIPHEFNAPWDPCALLERWEDARDELVSYPEDCPFAAGHRINVLCPYGFWGFKHVIEQPPSVRQGVLKTAIRPPEGARAAVARSLALDEAMTKDHLAELRTSLGSRFEIADCASRAELREALADPALPLVYFYCHGKWAELGETSLRVPYLEIGRNDAIGPNDFAAWSKDAGWGERHWREVSPLVFINGCHTVELTPEGIVSFVEALAGMNAAGVVGTEISVAQEIASEVAERFYSQLAGGTAVSVGTALHRVRIDLLRKGNVTGLVYTPFCSMDLVLERAGEVDAGRNQKEEP